MGASGGQSQIGLVKKNSGTKQLKKKIESPNKKKRFVMQQPVATSQQLGINTNMKTQSIDEDSGPSPLLKESRKPTFSHTSGQPIKQVTSNTDQMNDAADMSLGSDSFEHNNK